MRLLTVLANALTARETNNLRIAMQTDDATLETVKVIEELSGVSTSVAVTEEAKVLVGDTVSVVGAGLNAADKNAGVTLNIVKVDASEIRNQYQYRVKNEIPIGISLAGTIQSDGSLDIPVTITMKIPEAIDASKLQIYHMNADGSIKEILYAGNSGLKVNNGYGTVTFTVTHFSTFVFAEGETEEPSKTTVDEDEPQSNNENSENSSGDASDDSREDANPKVSEKVSNPVIYRVQRGDTLSKIAKKNGVSLKALIIMNPQIKNLNLIYLGQPITVGYTESDINSSTISEQTVLTTDAVYDIVKKGDTLSRIAVRNQIKLSQLASMNPELMKQRYIYAGQKVRVR